MLNNLEKPNVCGGAIGRRVAIGAIWLVSARFVTKGMDLIAMLIVARILTPADFGLVALATTVLLILDAVTDISLGNALIQMHDPSAEVYDTAFTLAIIRGAALALCIIVISWPISLIYNEPRLVLLLLILSVQPLLKGIVSPRLIEFSRNLSFRQSFIIEASGKIVAFAAVITITLATRSYWALVSSPLAVAGVSAIVSYCLAPYRPKICFEQWRAIFSFSGWLTLSQIVNTLNYQSDRLFIGRGLGSSVLGAYVIGNELASLPTQAPIQPIMQALYAGFARVAGDREKLRAAYLSSQEAVMMLAVPLGLMASVIAKPLILLTVGDKWSSAILIVQVLAPVFAIQMLTGAAHSIAMATGQTRAILYRDITSLCIRLPLILLGMYIWGLEGVIGMRVISGLSMIYLNLELMKRIVGIGLLKQCLAPWRSILSGGLMVVTTWGLESFLVKTLPEYSEGPILIVATAIFGALVYMGCQFFLWTLAGFPSGAERRLVNMARQAISS